MINIIPTLTVMKDVLEYENMVENFIASSSAVFRCNASRFTNNVYLTSIDILRDIYIRKTGKCFKLMLDIPYPGSKIRIGYDSNDNEIAISSGEIIQITNQKELSIYGTRTLYVNIDIQRLALEGYITLGDGDVYLKVLRHENATLICESLSTGILGIGKALYSKNYSYSNTDQNIRNNCFELIRELRPEFIALSFIEDGAVVQSLTNELISLCGYCPQIIAKIETCKGIKKLPEILAVCKSVMIGRGDLALTGGYEGLYKNQKEIIDVCSENKAIVYVATEIMNSLVSAQTPTRPEVCDLAYLIDHNVQNIILSGPLCRYNNYNNAVKYIRAIENNICGNEIGNTP